MLNITYGQAAKNEIDYGAPIWMNPFTGKMENVPGTTGQAKLNNIPGIYNPGNGQGATLVPSDGASKEAMERAGRQTVINQGKVNGQGNDRSPVAQPSTASGGYDDMLRKMLGQQMDRDNQYWSEYGALKNRIQGQANPFDTNSAAYKQFYANQMDGVTRAFAPAMARQQGSLGAQSHGMGSALGAALDRGRRAAMSNTGAQLNYNALRDSQAFQQTQNSQLAGLLSGMRQDPSSLALTLAGMDRENERYGQQQFNDLLMGGGALGMELLKILAGKGLI